MYIRSKYGQRVLHEGHNRDNLWTYWVLQVTVRSPGGLFTARKAPWNQWTTCRLRGLPNRRDQGARLSIKFLSTLKKILIQISQVYAYKCTFFVLYDNYLRILALINNNWCHVSTADIAEEMYLNHLRPICINTFVTKRALDNKVLYYVHYANACRIYGNMTLHCTLSNGDLQMLRPCFWMIYVVQLEQKKRRQFPYREMIVLGTRVVLTHSYWAISTKCGKKQCWRNNFQHFFLLLW